MLDWLRYFPLAFRNSPTKSTALKGPYFPALRQRCWVLGDNVFRLKTPRSNSVYGTEMHKYKVRNTFPGKVDILSESWPSKNQARQTHDRWQHGFFFYQEWLFLGTWFSGVKSEISLSANVVNAKDCSDYEGSSFFHPRVFETVIADYLNSYFGHEKVGRKPHYRGPLNWQCLNFSNSIKGVRCDIHQIGNTSRDNPKLQRHIFLPISHERFIKLDFNFGGTPINDSNVDSKPLFELCDSIIETFSLEVGPDTQTQWDSVKKHCPDMSLTSEFGELKWPIKPEDVGKAQALPREDNDIPLITGAEK